MKTIYPIKDACIGCHLCEIGCITEHSVSKDPIRAFIHEKERPISRCRVEEFDDGISSLSTRCRHCPQPDCIAACAFGAISKNADGVVLIDAEKCVGCWSCVTACPYAAIKRNPEKKKASKCDLCPDRATAACIDACPNRALVYREGN